MRRRKGVEAVITDDGEDAETASPPAFDAWVAARGPALLRLAYVLTGNAADAEDAVQDALSRALPRWDRIVQADDLDAYVRRMVVNAHTSWWRRFRRRESPSAFVATGETVPGPGEGDGPEHDERRAVWSACQALPEAQRTAVVLRYYEQLDYAEIAALTGVREGTVRSRVSRGLAALRTHFVDHDGRGERGEQDA
ncbi:DNA-directed RNA polymerase sigma-70 factor [Pimelobacter simplex]|nr:DNA-directed RNA polymerase sigma-70 factor [Pimelobacter simplex]